MTYLTVSQAAARLGVGYSTLKQWIYQGRVHTTQTPGGHHRIAESELDRLLTRRDAGRPSLSRGRCLTAMIRSRYADAACLDVATTPTTIHAQMSVERSCA